MTADLVSRLRRARASMLGTEDEDTYAACHEAAKELEQLRLDVAQQTINASTIIEMQKQLRECERALHLYSGGTSEYFDRHPLRDDVPATTTGEKT